MAKKYFGKILFLVLIFSTLILSSCSPGGVVRIKGIGNIEDVSITPKTGNTVEVIKETGFSILGSLKMILFAVFIFYLVYSGARLILSMGTDEEKISAAKRHIWHSLIGIIFINVPGTIYNAFFKSSQGTIKSPDNWTGSGTSILIGSGFYSFLGFLIGGLQVFLFFTALIIIIYTGLRFILMGRDPKSLDSDKKKLFYSVIVLLFVGFIEVWKKFTFTGDLKIGFGILGSIINLMLYIAPLVAFFYILLAGYYLITSAGNEEKLKKARDIILYVFLGTLIFLATFSILIEINSIKL